MVSTPGLLDRLEDRLGDILVAPPLLSPYKSSVDRAVPTVALLAPEGLRNSAPGLLLLFLLGDSFPVLLASPYKTSVDRAVSTLARELSAMLLPATDPLPR